MLKIYIIGSNRFNGLKRNIYDNLKVLQGVTVLAVGFSEVYDIPLAKKDYDNLHDLEDKTIDESDVIILVNNDRLGGEPYIGKDTQREIDYANKLNKTIWTSDMLFENYLKIKDQQ